MLRRYLMDYLRRGSVMLKTQVARHFTRRTAGTYIPATNPFLKRLFNTIVETDAVSKIDWAIDDLVLLLSQVDMGSILEDFGRRTRQEDPVVHFYETFLAAYNAALRKSSSVYYTPEPVVSFMVRSRKKKFLGQFLPLSKRRVLMKL